MLDVQLLGRPSVCLDGVPVDGPRGHKTWGLLAYLVGVGVPVPRDRLVALLFPDADDGLAALRWNLAQLRRAVRSPQAFRGDPVAVALGPDVGVDPGVPLSAGPGVVVVRDLSSATGLLVRAVGSSASPSGDVAEQLLDRLRKALTGTP